VRQRRALAAHHLVGCPRRIALRRPQAWAVAGILVEDGTGRWMVAEAVGLGSEGGVAVFSARTAPAGSRYQDQRHYTVVATLEELRGPARGLVTLERHLDWSSDPEYDLHDPGDLQLLYQTVLNEAATPHDLQRLLNADLLRRVWPSLWLPRQVRLLWEARFPELSRPPRRIAG
jgi:hypothetical protein